MSFRSCCAPGRRALMTVGAMWTCMPAGVGGMSAPNIISAGAASEPYLIRLRRELSPVRRKGKIVSHKASYSGLIHVGAPRAQEFRVVFDTGSGHVILPSIGCKSSTCLKHQRYDIAVSETAEAIMMDGSPTRLHGLKDQVTIGFGTGKITGEFVRDKVCLGPVQHPSSNLTSDQQIGPCIDTQVVMAIEMSDRPFELFDFDGILGLGLHSLAVSKSFSFFNTLAESRQFQESHFGVFLTDGDDGEESEIAIGGHNVNRLLEPLSWVQLTKPEYGYWLVHIVSIRIDGKLLDLCNDGSCSGILDSGTSHLGIPSGYHDEMAELLTRDADGTVTDCRFTKAPTIQIELENFNFTLYPQNYMRKLPLSEDIMIDTNVGVNPTSYPETVNKEPAELPEDSAAFLENQSVIKTHCTPKLLPVSWPAPLGPNLIILGEPVLHRYYAVFDWGKLRAGFGLAKHKRVPKGRADKVTTTESSASHVDEEAVESQMTEAV